MTGASRGTPGEGQDDVPGSGGIRTFESGEGVGGPGGDEPTAVVVSCEHAGNRVPAEWQDRFHDRNDLLASHRGWDPGAEDLARFLAAALGAPLVRTDVTRLLVDTNRSPGHPRLFGPDARTLSEDVRRSIVARYHTPHRRRVEEEVEVRLRTGRWVLHLGVHTFTPVLDGRVREVDVGLLYDPSRERERRFCRAWGAALRRRLPDRRIRMNQPYRGTSDGLTTWLRSMFDGAPGGEGEQGQAARYLGVELEVSQGMLHEGEVPEDIRDGILRALREVLAADHEDPRATRPGTG